MQQATNATVARHEEQAVIQSIRDMVDAWSQRDGARFAQAFDEEAEFINVRGERSRGRPQLAHFAAPVFEASLKESRLQLPEIQVRFIRPDVASATAHWHLGAEVAAPSQRHGWMHFVLTRTPERWVIAEMHTSEQQ